MLDYDRHPVDKRDARYARFVAGIATMETLQDDTI